MNIYQKYFIGLFVAAIGFLFYRKYGPMPDRLGPYQLKVSIDTTDRFYMESLDISAKYFRKPHKEVWYDSVRHMPFLVFDSIRESSVEIKLVSLLDRTYSRKIKLHGDTTIILSKDELPNFEQGATKDFDLTHIHTGEEIWIRAITSGFVYHDEKAVIRKKESGYDVRFTAASSNGTKQSHLSFNDGFTDSLAKFQTGFISYFNEKGDTGKCINSTRFYFRRGNKSWSFNDKRTWYWSSDDDDKCKDDTVYYRFIKSFGFNIDEINNSSGQFNQ